MQSQYTCSRQGGQREAHVEEIPNNRLSCQIKVYEERRGELEVDYSGKWVVFHGGYLVNVYNTFTETIEDAVKQFGRGPYLIRQVGQGPAALPIATLYELH